jgi:hypothetical protein
MSGDRVELIKRGFVSLTSVKVLGNVIDRSAFRGCVNLETVEIQDGVTGIGRQAFADCVNLTTVKIPSSVTTIDVLAFYGCVNLEVVEIPADCTVSSYVFGKCHRLNPTKIFGVLRVGVFSDCLGLKRVDIPDGVVKIENLAFAGCLNLYTVVIPSSVREISASAFAGCVNLRRIWNNSKCAIPNSVWISIRGTPTLKALRRWTLHLMYLRPLKIVFYCLSVPVELCDIVCGFIPQDERFIGQL